MLVSFFAVCVLCLAAVVSVLAIATNEDFRKACREVFFGD